MTGELDDDQYGSLPGFAKMPELAANFPFGPDPPCAAFPSDFADYYASFATAYPVDHGAEATFFIAHFKNQPLLCMYDGLFSPQTIQSQNRIIFGLEPGQRPSKRPFHGYYAIGSAYEDSGGLRELRILICLDEKKPAYGKIYAWPMRWRTSLKADFALIKLGWVANSLREMIEGLQTEKEVAAKLSQLNQQRPLP